MVIEVFETAEVVGSGRAVTELAVPYHGRNLTGADLRHQLDVWVADWGHWLANLADEPGIEACAVTIETAPDTGTRLRREVEHHRAAADVGQVFQASQCVPILGIHSLPSLAGRPPVASRGQPTDRSSMAASPPRSSGVKPNTSRQMVSFSMQK